MSGRARRGFVPIAGLHHAGRAHAAGFCVFNDIGVVIEKLKREHGLVRIAYVDIDAHHGDGVFYAFEDDPAVVFADTHEDGRFLYPGTGAADEIGSGAAAGTKLNLPLPPGAGDAEFRAAWPVIEAHLERHAPEFVLFQCGADSLGGDPITHLGLTEEAHGHAAERLVAHRRTARSPGASSASAAAATTGATSPAPGPASCGPSSKAPEAGLSGRLRAPFSARLQAFPCSDAK